MQRFHATCVALEGCGILLTGPSGSGKSDLALRLIERGALLVADDQVEVSVERGQLIARPPVALRGLIEARYIGPLSTDYSESVALRLVLISGSPERYPEPQTASLLDIKLPQLQLPYLEASTPIKIALWLKQQESQHA